MFKGHVSFLFMGYRKFPTNQFIENFCHYFIFLTCPLKREEGRIRTNDLRFIRRGFQPNKLPLGTSVFIYLTINTNRDKKLCPH
jgi:hypothetical protein